MFKEHDTLSILTIMIRSLRGTIQSVSDGYAVVDVRGVGYLVACPATTRFDIDQEVFLHTYLAVRETALDLYGFTEQSEIETFELLLGVPKVGPKSALQILSQASPTLISEATEKNDPVYLHKLSGIGKKTCENVIQYLQGKKELLPDVGTVNSELNTIETDAIDALIALGYDTTAARDVVLKLYDENATVNSLVRDALKQL